MRKAISLCQSFEAWLDAAFTEDQKDAIAFGSVAAFILAVWVIVP